jgi:hypothetical protein
MALACADGKLRFEPSEWQVWDSDEATATGMVQHPNQEDPVCANKSILACPWVEAAATIRLWAPVYCSSNGRWQFLRLRIDSPEDLEPESRVITRHFQCRDYAPYVPPKPPKPAKPPRRPYWHDCGYPASYALKTVIVHRVACTKAKRLIRKVWRLGQESGGASSLSVDGFYCVLVGGSRKISCEQGSRKVRGPLPG